MLRMVLLPQPDGPMIDTTSPRRILKFTSRMAKGASDLPLAGKHLPTLRNSISVGSRSSLECGVFHWGVIAYISFTAIGEALWSVL
ncbi:hypothetical protein D3C77_626840 [compost metagenome]